jgi:hypothetical protein
LGFLDNSFFMENKLILSRLPVGNRILNRYLIIAISLLLLSMVVRNLVGAGF